MRRISSNSESGAILAIVIILMLALTITGIAFLNAGVMEYRLASREVHKNKAFYIAEGGLERTIWNLRQHFKTAFESRWPSEDEPGVWQTDVVNEIPVDPVGGSLWTWTIQYGEEGSLPGNLGDGSYEVQLEYIPGEDKVRIESTGTFKGTSRIVQIYMEKGYFYPWDTAIFAGESAVAGSIINGNVRVHGSIVILAEHLGEPSPEEPAVELMDLSGDAGIRNNYEGMPDELALRIPELPLVLYDEEPYSPEVQSLKATLRVRKGAVKLGGNVKIGEDNTLLPSIKGFMDGLYVDRGFILSGNADLYYDDYDESSGLGGITFPTLTEPGPETSGVPRIDYLQSPLNSISLPDTITEISSDIESFWTDTGYDIEPGLPPGPLSASNYIIWNQEQGLLTISGIICLEAASLDLGKAHETIEYSGKGIIVVAEKDQDPETGEDKISGQIRVHGDLLAEGEDDPYDPDKGGFPNHVLGLVTGRIELATGEDEAQLTMTGAFFAENEIVSAKQNEIAGTFITRQFNIAKNVPRLYQVPALKDKMPVGMPGGEPIRYALFTGWSES